MARTTASHLVAASAMAWAALGSVALRRELENGPAEGEQAQAPDSGPDSDLRRGARTLAMANPPPPPPRHLTLEDSHRPSLFMTRMVLRLFTGVMATW